MAVALRSIDAVPHEVQRQRGTQGLLVQRKTMASQPFSHYSQAADNDRRRREVEEKRKK